MPTTPPAPSPRVRIAFTAVVSVAVIAALVAVFLPSLGRARHSSPAAKAFAAPLADAYAYDDADRATLFSTSRVRGQHEGVPISDDRAIARQATIGLKIDNLADAYAQVSHIARPALGEYVHSSGYRAHDQSNSAQVTLRIVSDRLDAALAEIRALGDATFESSGADDVTDRLVDLDAHVRNEQRVEREMLELMESRSGDPLKDLLELRESLADVRLQIERLLAQQGALERRVAYATVHVTLHTESTTQAGVFAHAWSNGVNALIISIAWLVQVIVGGTVAWIFLASSAIVLWRIFKSRTPAPAVVSS